MFRFLELLFRVYAKKGIIPGIFPIMFALISSEMVSATSGFCSFSCDQVEVDCSSMNISSVSSLFYSDITSSSNSDLLNGSSIIARMQKKCSTTRLDLRNNSISAIHARDFAQMIGLESLDLSGNMLSEIPPNVFYLHSLLSLNISFNQINLIHNQSFKYLPRLEILDISGNPLVHLTYAWLHPLSTLTHFYISKCDIEAIPEFLGARLPNLKVLDLSQNKIRFINNFELRQWGNILDIDLTGNYFHCDCKLVDLQIWILNNTNKTSLDYKCGSPWIVRGYSIVEIPNLCNLSQYERPHGGFRRPIRPTFNTMLPYDPMMGISTAAVLSGMLVLFLLCILLDKLKRRFKRWLRRRRDKDSLYSYSVGHLDSNSKLHTFPDDNLNRTGSFMNESQCNCDMSRNSISVQSNIDVYQKSLCLPRISIDGRIEQYHSDCPISANHTETRI